jgi:multicomponent Na+:H+ antiporter subunit C
MRIVIAVTVGVLFACSVYLMTRRSLVRLVVGTAMLTYAVNLMLFTVGDISKRGVPIIGVVAPAQMADPLPQALVLTAIVISFGLLAFTLTLAYRANQLTGGDDLDALESTDDED